MKVYQILVRGNGNGDDGPGGWSESPYDNLVYARKEIAHARFDYLQIQVVKEANEILDLIKDTGPRATLENLKSMCEGRDGLDLSYYVLNTLEVVQ